MPGCFRVLAIATSACGTCTSTDAGVHCWGGNEDGVFGDGTMNSAHTPTHVATLAGGMVADLQLGCFHACARLDGQLHCWGNNSTRALGDGTTVNRWLPVPIFLP